MIVSLWCQSYGILLNFHILCWVRVRVRNIKWNDLTLNYDRGRVNHIWHGDTGDTDTAGWRGLRYNSLDYVRPRRISHFVPCRDRDESGLTYFGSSLFKAKISKFIDNACVSTNQQDVQYMLKIIITFMLQVFSAVTALLAGEDLVMTYSICQDLFPVSQLAASDWSLSRCPGLLLVGGSEAGLWMVEVARGRLWLAEAEAWRPQFVIWLPEPRTYFRWSGSLMEIKIIHFTELFSKYTTTTSHIHIRTDPVVKAIISYYDCRGSGHEA